MFYRRYVPETPSFLASQNRIAEAKKVLSIPGSGTLRSRNLMVRDI
nr:hypothetical protein [Aminobacter aminovorans]